MPVELILILLCLFYENCTGYLERVTISGCESCTLRLTCRGFDAIIAVVDAQFIPFESTDSSVAFNLQQSTAVPVQPRKALNQRCSGVNHCSFILTKDCPGASTLGLGNITVDYFCVAEPKLTKHCNQNLTLSWSRNQAILEGLVHNPGYPRFYLGIETCHWTIKALPWQKIKITILDISLLGYGPENCSDIFQIKESKHVLLSSCLQEESFVEVLSAGNEIEILLKPSSNEELLPRRGVLFHYTAVGCATPFTPKNSHFLGRNDSTAEFSCDIDFAFPDTHLRTKFIKCIENKWDSNIPLPDCDNATVVEAETVNLISSDLYTTKRTMTERATISEIVIPTMIIILLLVLNSVVLFMIYRYKKRKESEYSEEELGTLPINCDKSSTSRA
ncbi:uncharacterized protein LOC108737429 [Agrilus planipennis]|uniref:Uncharacterized protein LOC108737429 n=1 Tax=Agrilus planipennis TaxID=224129 RepID=A0A1W4X0C5_AGRPL|nr:uncharacterized protein LOC108737429 [Agrilus planipennis]